MENLYIETSGWQYPEWKGRFYPNEMPANKQLKHYSSMFNSVELNSSYYQFPKLENISEWKILTTNDFLICPRLIQTMTLKKRLKGGDNMLKAFLAHFHHLEDQLGPIIVEIPSTIPFEHPNVHPFLEMLGRFSNGYTFVIEPRHISWTNPKASTLCQEKGLTWSISDFCGKFPTIQKVTGDSVYLRFHGTDQLQQSKYTEKTLKNSAEKVKNWIASGKQVYVFFNNTHEDHALENARQFKSLVLS